MLSLTAVKSKQTDTQDAVKTSETSNLGKNSSNLELLPLEIILNILQQTASNGDFILSGRDLVRLTHVNSFCHCIVDLPGILARIETAKIKAMQNALQNYQKALPENHPDRSLIFCSSGYGFHESAFKDWTFGPSVGLQFTRPHYFVQ